MTTHHIIVDPEHPVYNEVPGCYSNRIVNGTFTLNGVTYNLVKNDGPNTLHCGPNNWSTRFWNLIDVTNSSITFAIYDPANSTGMPGHVEASVTYSWKERVEYKDGGDITRFPNPYYVNSAHLFQP